MIEPIPTEEIYDAIVDDDRFAQLPARLASAFHARSAMIHWLYGDGSAAVLSHSGYFNEEQLGLYANRFVSLDPWVRASTGEQPPNVAMDLEALVPEQLFIRSEFYNEYIKAMGDDTCRCLGVRVENKWGSGFIALQRGHKQPGFEPEAIAAMTDVAAHLRRMLSVRGKLPLLTSKADLLSDAIDALGQAIFVVTAQGRILHLNAAAEEMLKACGGLLVFRGMLGASNPAADRSLKTMIASAGASCNPAAGALRIGPADAPTILSIAPIPSSMGRQVLLVASPPSQDDSAVNRLRLLYKLSHGEARLAMMLASGMGPAEIASERGVSLGTVRAQIKSISAKIGCHRQSEIVSIVQSLPRLHRPRDQARRPA